jgi:hypothetical protein
MIGNLGGLAGIGKMLSAGLGVTGVQNAISQEGGTAQINTSGVLDQQPNQLTQLENRVSTLESSSSQASANIAPAQPSNDVGDPVLSQPGDSALDQPIKTGRFSEDAQMKANAIYGTERERASSVGMAPAAVAGANDATQSAIANIIKMQQVI